MLINNVMKKRKEKNLTQLELAYRIKISESQIRNIEKSRSIPNIEIVLKLAKELGCTVEELFYIINED